MNSIVPVLCYHCFQRNYAIITVLFHLQHLMKNYIYAHKYGHAKIKDHQVHCFSRRAAPSFAKGSTVTTELFNSQRWQSSEQDKVRLCKEQHEALE